MSYKEQCGALWLKKTANGETFMSGEIRVGERKLPITIFKNDKGDNERRPDYRIFPRKPREGQPDPWDEVKEPVDAPF